jgi:hypothetical protein
MDSKKIISKLVKIAESQQKIINKLAQALPPQHLDPNRSQKRSAEAVLNALAPETRQTIVNIEEKDNDMLVGFKPGQKTQKNYDAVLATMQKLTNDGVLQHAYNLKAV